MSQVRLLLTAFWLAGFSAFAAEPISAAGADAQEPVIAEPVPAPVEKAEVSEAARAAPAPLPIPEPQIPVSEPPDALKEPQDLDFGWMLLRSIVVLGIVLLSIYVVLNQGLRRLMGQRGPTGNADIAELVQRLPLDAKRSLFVIKAAGEYLLVGGGDDGLQLLSKLDANEVEKLRAETKTTSALQLSPFLQKLLLRRDGAPPPSQGGT